MRNSEGQSPGLQPRMSHRRWPKSELRARLQRLHSFEAQIMSSGQALSPLPLRHLHRAGPRVAL